VLRFKPFWDAENIAFTGMRSLHRPANSESLYILCHPGPPVVVVVVVVVVIYMVEIDRKIRKCQASQLKVHQKLSDVGFASVFGYKRENLL